VPFLSVILILEEALPFVVIYAPFLLPSTCKLPSQQRRIDSIADQKRAKALLFANDALSTANTGVTSLLPGGGSQPIVVQAIARYECRLAGVFLFYSPSLQGAWSSVVPPDIDPTRPYHPPPPNHCRTRCSNIPRRSQWPKPLGCVHPGRAQDNSRQARIVRFIFVLSAIDTQILMFGLTVRLLASPQPSYERTYGIT
jgi:hypothetical protein